VIHAATVLILFNSVLEVRDSATAKCYLSFSCRYNLNLLINCIGCHLYILGKPFISTIISCWGMSQCVCFNSCFHTVPLCTPVLMPWFLIICRACIQLQSKHSTKFYHETNIHRSQYWPAAHLHPYNEHW